jgi:branched-chain amino acid transport system substrate-binding protein
MTTYGRGLAKEFVKAAQLRGMEIVGHEGITQGEKDFTPLLTKVKAMGPELIYFAGMFPEGALLIKQRFELKIPAHFLGGDGLYEPALIDLATPAAAEGVTLTTLGADIRQVPTAQGFVQAFEARYGHVGAYSSYAYEAARIVLEAIRRAGRKDRKAILLAMRQIGEYPGILGTHTFDEHGDTTVRTIGIFVVRGGKFQFLETADPSG